MRSGRVLNVAVDLLGLRAYVDQATYDGWAEVCGGGRPLPERVHAIHREIAEAMIARFDLAPGLHVEPSELAFSLRLQSRAWDLLAGRYRHADDLSDEDLSERPFPTMPLVGLFGELLAALLTLRSLDDGIDIARFTPSRGVAARQRFLEALVDIERLESAKLRRQTKERLLGCMMPSSPSTLEEVARAVAATGEDHRRLHADLLGYHAMWRMSTELFENLGELELTVWRAALEFWTKLWLSLIEDQVHAREDRVRLALAILLRAHNPLRRGLGRASLAEDVAAPLREQTVFYLSIASLWQRLIPARMPEGYAAVGVEQRERADARLLTSGIKQAFEQWAKPLQSALTTTSTSPMPAAVIGLVSTALLGEGPEAAESLARQAVAANPDAWQPRYALAEVLLHQGRADEAYELCDVEMGDERQEAQMLEIKARASWKQGRRDEAFKLIRAASSKDPDNATLPDLDSRWSNRVAVEKSQAGRRGSASRRAFIEARKKAELAMFLGSPTAAAGRLLTSDAEPDSAE